MFPPGRPRSLSPPAGAAPQPRPYHKLLKKYNKIFYNMLLSHWILLSTRDYLQSSPLSFALYQHPLLRSSVPRWWVSHVGGATKLGHNWTSVGGLVWAQITFVFVNQLTREFTALLYYTVFSTLYSVVSLSLSLALSSFCSLSQQSTFALK